MKLVIDISEETYTQIRDNILFGEDYKSVIWDITGAIVNSIPLEDIKVEIEALEDKMLNVPNDWRTSEVFENVLDVIDKYKAESEE